MLPLIFDKIYFIISLKLFNYLYYVSAKIDNYIK